jgi:hypothetical protein
MFPAASAQMAPGIAPLGRPLDQPSAYSPIPQRLITDLHDNPLAIGLYGFVARLYLIAQTPIPLSVPDVLRYDPTLSRGAVLRALARLIAGGYLIEAAQPGLKTRYTPAWGRIGGIALAWNMEQPCLGRPRHVARLRLDRRLFDICMGKLTPHATRAAPITRYVTMPVLSLTDVGCYALTLAGLPRATQALLRLGAVQNEAAYPLPSDERLLALISQRALDLGERANLDIGLTISGTRKLGVAPFLAPDGGTTRTQPLFFVPPDMIGTLIRPMIGSMIGSDAPQTVAATAAVWDEVRADDRDHAITWESRETRDTAISPPSPPYDEAKGGGGAEPIMQRASTRRRLHLSPPLPDTEVAAILQAINIKPAQIVELAQIPLTTVEAAIADGRARPGIRDLAGWVVSLLRAHRDYGWKITPPAPAPDSPEALSIAFARYAAEQQAAKCEEPDDVEVDDTEMMRVSECAEDDDRRPVSCVLPRPLLVRLWNDVQAEMRMRITRQEFTTWIRPAALQSVEHEVATISAPSIRIKNGLEQRYTPLLCELLTEYIGAPIQLRVIVHDERLLVKEQLAATAIDAATTEALAPAMDSKMLAPPASNHRPDWISVEQWTALPTMLRAALIGSTLAEGKVLAISPHLTMLIEMRYAPEVAALLSAVNLGACSTITAPAVSTEDDNRSLAVRGAGG